MADYKITQNQPYLGKNIKKQNKRRKITTPQDGLYTYV